MEFIKVDLKYFYYCEELSYQEILIYCYLEHKAKFSNSSVKVSNGTIARVFNIDRSRVAKCLKKLVESNFIRVHNLKDGRNIFVFSLEKHLQESTNQTRNIIRELKEKWAKQ